MSAPVGGVADGAKAVISKDGVTIEEAPIAIEAGSADVKVVLTNAITESGVYTLTLPRACSSTRNMMRQIP